MRDKTQDIKEFSAFLKYMRASIGFNKSQMGRALGVNQATIRRWEEGMNKPTQDLYLAELKIREVVKSELRKGRDK